MLGDVQHQDEGLVSKLLIVSHWSHLLFIKQMKTTHQI